MLERIARALVLTEIEREHLRVHGASKIIWLEQGPKEEEAGRLGNGRWGIGTGGHVDEFARFADERTHSSGVITAMDSRGDPVLSWELTGVLPVRWTGPSLNADSSKVAIETLELAHHGFQVKG